MLALVPSALCCNRGPTEARHLAFADTPRSMPHVHSFVRCLLLNGALRSAIFPYASGPSAFVECVLVGNRVKGE